MRTELQALQGQQVVCVGDVTTDTRKVKGVVYLCLVNVNVYAYDENRQLRLTKPTVKTDHLWVQQDLDAEGAVIFAGTIQSYSRKDGTEDYAVSQVNSLYLPAARRTAEAAAAANPAKLHPETVRGLLDQLNAYEGGIYIDFNSNQTPRNAYLDIRASLNSTLRRIDLARFSGSQLSALQAVKNQRNYPSCYSKSLDKLFNK